MTISIRDQLVEAVKDRLGLIAPGYVFQLPDGGTHTCSMYLVPAPDGSPGVYSWRKVPFSVQQIPAIEFRDTETSVSEGPSGQHEHRLSIQGEIYIPGGTVASAARAMMADLLAAIFSDRRWGNLARWTELDSYTLDVEQAGDIIAGIKFDFAIIYRTPYGRM